MPRPALYARMKSRNLEGESTEGRLLGARLISIVLMVYCVEAVTGSNADSLATNVVLNMFNTPDQIVTADKHRSNSFTTSSKIISSSSAFPRSSVEFVSSPSNKQV